MIKSYVILFLASVMAGCAGTNEGNLNAKPVNLEFMETYFPSEIASNWSAAYLVARAKREEMKLSDSIAAKTSLTELGQFPALEILVKPVGEFAIGAVLPGDREKVDSILSIPEVKEQFPENLQFMWSTYPEKEMSPTGEPVYLLYAIRKPNTRKEAITGKYIKQASVGFDEQAGQVTIDMTMDKKGTELWAQMTSDNVNRIVAICIDGTVMSAPRVANAITQGNTQISGSFTLQEAEEIVGGINAGRRKK